MRKNGGLSPWALALIVVLICLTLWLGVAALLNQQEYRRMAATTPTPSITPPGVRVTEDPSQPTSTPTPRLFQLNSMGVEVRELQRRLQELGYDPGEPDGVYGGGTVEAVKRFQRQHGLKDDGIAGEQTLSLLESGAAQTYAPTPTPSATPANGETLSAGAKGESVRQLQERLQELGFYSGTLDGDYGQGTMRAVKVFQKQHDLDDDGIAGPKTLTMLYSDQAKQIVVTPTPEAIEVLAGEAPLLVNREHALDADFIPSDLVDMSTYCDPKTVTIKYSGTQGVRAAVDALTTMLTAAEQEGVGNWQVSAAYRSIEDQQRIFDETVKDYMNDRGMSRSQATSATRLTVADPGTSEHHTGLAFDMTVPGTTSFKGTKQCTWLHEHCWEYGFIIRYTDDKQDITGFLGEEWHIRYVGAEHSLAMRDNDWCLEEYLQFVVEQ